MKTYATDPYNIPQFPRNATKYDQASQGAYDCRVSLGSEVSVMVLTAGNVQVTPAGGQASVTIAYSVVPAMLPFQVSDIGASTTSDLMLIY